MCSIGERDYSRVCPELVVQTSLDRLQNCLSALHNPEQLPEFKATASKEDLQAGPQP